MIAEFFSALYGVCADGYLVVRTADGIEIEAFPSERLDDAVAWCERRKANSVYFGVGLRRVRPPPGKRGTSDTVGWLTALWADVDTAEGLHARTDLPTLERALETLTALPHPPSLIVETGGGAHAYWLLREPWELLDPREQAQARETVRRWQQYLRLRLRTHLDDTSDLARDLRVPGTANTKYDPRRAVRVVGGSGSRYEIRDLDELALETITAARLPIDASTSLPAAPAVPTGFAVAGGRNDRLKQIVAACLDRSEILDICVREVFEYDTRHHAPALFSDPSDTAHVIADPWTNALAFVTRICASINRTRIAQGLAPQRLRSFDEPETPEPIASPLNFEAWTSAAYLGQPNPRQWLVRNLFPARVPSMVAAMGDAGKSMLLLDLAMKVALRPPPQGWLAPPLAFGSPIERHGSVVMLTAEDDHDEVHTRLHNLDRQGDLSTLGDRLIVIPLPNAGGPFALVQRGRTGPEASSMYGMLLERLKKVADLACVIFDPLSSFVHIDVNADPVAGAFACSLFARMATVLQASVILAHHMRKNSIVDGPDAAREAIRGSSALVDGLRSVYVLWAVGEDYATKILERQDRKFERGAVWHGATVKANGPADRAVRTYVRDPATGILLEATDRVRVENQDAHGKAKELLVFAIRTAEQNGKPYTRNNDDGLYARRHELPAPLSTSARVELARITEELLASQRLILIRDGKKSLLSVVDPPT